MSLRLSHVPIRLATGAFILNSGLSKWGGDKETAESLHGFASGAYPVLKNLDAPTFLKSLSTSEIALGAALLTPIVPAATAGLGLAAFSGGLLGLYARTPGMRDGIRPTQQGTPIAKDVWMFGIAAALIIDGLADRRKKVAVSA